MLKFSVCFQQLQMDRVLEGGTQSGMTFHVPLTSVLAAASTPQRPQQCRQPYTEEHRLSFPRALKLLWEGFK